MTTTTTPGAEATLGRDDLVTVMDDQAWVDAEFAAIMAASGIADLTVIALAPRSPAPGDLVAAAPREGEPTRARSMASRRLRRVRSPPHRGSVRR